MISLRMVLLIVAVICFALAAAGVPSGRFSLLAFGLFCWALGEIAH